VLQLVVYECNMVNLKFNGDFKSHINFKMTKKYKKKKKKRSKDGLIIILISFGWKFKIIFSHKGFGFNHP
jgi:hypothetical protein